MFVTVELLDKLEACKVERNRFAELFPSGVELTRKLIVNHAQEFSWSWCAENLVGANSLAKFLQAIEPAQAAYKQAIMPVYAVYQQATEQAYTVYRRAVEPAWAVYLQAKKPAYVAYRRAVNEAWAVYLQAIEPARTAYRRAEEQALATLNLARANAFAAAIGL